MERIYSHEARAGQKVCLSGWVEKIRDMGGLKFFILRDREGSIQVTLKKGKADEKLMKIIGNINREDCVSVEGMAEKAGQAPGGIEVVPEKIELVSKAKSPLQIETSDKIETGFDKRLDYRFMDLRNPKVQALFRVKDVAIAKIREYFASNKFVEVHTPVIQAAGAEGGATLFPLVYYQKEAFLRQSPQLYKQMLMSSGLDRVYEIGPAFRAEKFRTRRHVSEFLSVDFEMAWVKSEEDVMKMLEGMFAHAVKGVKKDCRCELEILNAKVDVPELPLKRITYDEALDALKKGGFEIEWGEDLRDVEEAKLGEIMAKKGLEAYFITKWPEKMRAFYIMEDGRHSHGIDLAYRGLELASGGQREHRYEQLVARMKKKGLTPENFKFYLDAFSYGMPPHGGIGFGVERLVQKIAGVETIQEVIMFPRTPERIVP